MALGVTRTQSRISLYMALQGPLADIETYRAVNYLQLKALSEHNVSHIATGEGVTNYNGTSVTSNDIGGDAFINKHYIASNTKHKI